MMGIAMFERSEHDMPLGEHFKVSEMACPCGKCDITLVSTTLAGYLNKIRDIMGSPVRINSGFRCPAHNRDVGGKSRSYHQWGFAADIVVDGHTPDEVAGLVIALGISCGQYDTFTHIDVRPGPQVIFDERTKA